MNKNKLVVIARLDPIGNQILSDMKQTAHTLQHQHYANSADWPPHVTIAAYEGMDEKELCAYTSEYAATHSAFDIAFQELRIFPRAVGLETEVIYAFPTPSASLSAFHRGFHSRYDEYCGNYGRQSASADYTFHSTLTICHHNDTNSVMEKLQRNFSPFTARVVALEVYRNPCEFVARFELQASQKISIRTTLPEEIDTLTALQKSAFLPLYEKYHDEGNPYLRGAEDILMRMNENYRHFTIFCDNEVVGGIFYRVHGKYTPEKFLEDGEYYLCRIYIDPKHQNKGFANAAILLCEKEFPDAKRYFVDFPVDMEKNRRCYEKAGFHDTGERREADIGLTLALFCKEIEKNESDAPQHPLIFPVERDLLPQCLDVIHKSFATVAEEFGLTPENCPKHTSFIPLAFLETHLLWGWQTFGLFAGKKVIGYMSLSKKEGKTYELHNLAVLPEYRHLGFGKMMLDFVKETVRRSGGEKIEVGIIEESTVLKNWYIKNGFRHIGTKKYDHLPFTSGYLEWKVI
ncbi:MAG: GNAT family N-acetyltransferase [Clostridia bacterium]|nr:GNAT family N-acetyltransferase [Clostridia bacterium]